MDLGGRAAQRLGFPRSMGQIYSALYLSPKPLCLQDLMDLLQISKGGASMSVRQLAAWGAVRQVWMKGERRDFYEANADFGSLFRHFLFGLLAPRIETTGSQLQTMRQELETEITQGSETEQLAFMRDRIARLEQLQGKAGRLLPLVETLFK